LKGGKKIRGYDRGGDAVKIDEEIDSGKNNKNEPSVTVENPVRMHGEDPIRFLRGIPLFLGEIHNFSLKKSVVSRRIAGFLPHQGGAK
jgi:hypothetical protein